MLIPLLAVYRISESDHITDASLTSSEVELAACLALSIKARLYAKRAWILQGCMNNLTFGDSGMGYYETIAGGAGAGPDWAGRSGVHTHMTNTRITDPGDAELAGPYGCIVDGRWHRFPLCQLGPAWMSINTLALLAPPFTGSECSSCAQRFWSGGILWCCASSPCGLALEGRAGTGAAMGSSGR